MSAEVPRCAVDVLCQWELVKAVYPAGSGNRDTKTYIHRSPKSGVYSIIRMISGRFAGQTFLSPIEIHAIGDIA